MTLRVCCHAKKTSFPPQDDMIMLRVALGKEGPWGHRGLRENTRSSIYPDLAPSLSHVFLNKKMYSRCRFIYCQVCTTFVGGVIITNIVPKNFNIFSPSAAQRWGRNGQEVLKCTPGWWRQHFKDWGITAELLFDSYWERPALDSFLGILPKIKKIGRKKKKCSASNQTLILFQSWLLMT